MTAAKTLRLLASHPHHIVGATVAAAAAFSFDGPNYLLSHMHHRKLGHRLPHPFRYHQPKRRPGWMCSRAWWRLGSLSSICIIVFGMLDFVEPGADPHWCSIWWRIGCWRSATCCCSLFSLVVSPIFILRARLTGYSAHSRHPLVRDMKASQHTRGVYQWLPR